MEEDYDGEKEHDYVISDDCFEFNLVKPPPFVTMSQESVEQMIETRSDVAVFDVEQLFLDASMKGDLELLRSLLDDHGVSPNIRNEDRNTALHLATIMDDVAVVKYMLEYTRKPVDICIKNRNGDTPLMMALRQRSRGCIELLMADSRQTFDTRNENNETVLHLIAQQGSIHYLRMLKEKSFISAYWAMNIEDCMEYTPLECHLKSSSFRMDFVEEMLDLMDGASRDLQRRIGIVIETCMRHNLWKPMIKLFETSPVLIKRIYDGETALTWAIKNDSEELFKWLCRRHELEWNMSNNYEEYPVLLALRHSKRIWIQYILAQPTVHLDVHSGDTNLYMALLGSDRSISEKVDILNDLIDRIQYSRVTIPINTYRMDPYFIAVKYSQPHILNTLISRNIMIPRYVNKDFPYTLIGYAVFWNREMCLEELFKHVDVLGLNVNTPNIHGETPYTLAVRGGVKRIMDKIILHPNFEFERIDDVFMNLFLSKESYIIGKLVRSQRFQRYRMKHEAMRQLLKYVSEKEPDSTRTTYWEYLKMFYIDYRALYGEHMEHCPDKVYAFLLYCMDAYSNKEQLTQNQLNTIFDLFNWSSMRNMELYKRKIGLSMADIHLYNDTDPATLESFDVLPVWQYYVYNSGFGDSDNGCRAITEGTLLEMVKQSKYGYLEDVMDPYTREPLVEKDVWQSGLPIFIDVAARKFCAPFHQHECAGSLPSL